MVMLGYYNGDWKLILSAKRTMALLCLAALRTSTAWVGSSNLSISASSWRDLLLHALRMRGC
jgi:hypothetical protein